VSKPKQPAPSLIETNRASPTSDGGPGGFYVIRTSDGGPGGRAANSLFAGQGAVPPFVSPPPAGWEEHVPSDRTTKAIFGAKFPDDGWDPLMKAGIIAGRFARETDWINATECAWPEDDPQSPKYKEMTPEDARKAAIDALKADLKKMYGTTIADQRKNRKAEILEQEIGFTGYFYRLLACSTEVRPKAFLFVLVGIQIGALVCSHWKWQFQRQRPAQAWPGVNPIIATPRHPAYPSGHGVQALLIALMIGDIAPGLASTAMKMAERIAENRVIAGVHYPSDNKAAAEVAEKTFQLLQGFGEYKNLRALAYLELNGVPYANPNNLPKPEPIDLDP
jgi:hypothetical protein